MLDPVNGLLCLPAADMPARRRRTPAALLTGTTWVFDAPATPESQLTQLTTLTQALSQESEGADNGTHHGSLPLPSPHDKTRRSSAPAVLFAHEGGAAKQEDGGT